MGATYTAGRRATPGSLSSLRRNPGAPWRHLDLVLLGCVVAVALLGCLMVFSATRGRDPSSFDTGILRRQALFVVTGTGLLVATTMVDYRRFRELVPLAYGGILLLLVAAISGLGSERKGSQRWFEFGSFQLQPSEFAKVVVIVSLAAVIAHFNQELDLGRLLMVLAVPVVPAGLILLQPDVGTALVFIAIVMGVLLIGGASFRHIAALTAIGLVGVVTVLGTGAIEEYQRCRLTSFLDRQDDICDARWASYNQDQSMATIGSGGLGGRGLFQGSQTRLDIVPEQHTDFIFTAVGEELGFAGSATLLTLLAIIAWRVWRTAQLARDPLGTLICVGVLSMFVFQVFQNVGMAMGIMPVTGIPLPFMSYGGSSTLALFLAMGLVLNVHMRRFS